jgi:hypothetical protein
MIEPLELSYEIACPPSHAFEVWTERFSMWWPKGHAVSGDPDVSFVFEPRVGGRIFERTSAGEEIDWGRVTRWEPPHGLGYLWHIRRSPEEATDVDITFVGLDNGTTRLEIVHSGWERLGDAGPGWRDANLGGWNGLIPHFVGACEETGNSVVSRST